ncbi:MAG: phosphomethylpyrimidine synthase ThiC [Lentisphaeria bacterium]|nr:phosphomethylpyrimidine synthase ThiC [Lentisphaeria bacterium]
MQKVSQTQVDAAKNGIITPAMEFVAAKEKRSAEFIRDGVAAGRIVIPANKLHKNLSFMGIGRELYTKINANIGNSALTGTPEDELKKLRSVLEYGADTVMDLSTGGNIELIRKAIIERSSIPVGTVPVYEAVARYGREGITAENIIKVIADQAAQGVDYMTIHAGLLRKLLPSALKRKLGIVSRGGALIAAKMIESSIENPFYTAFDEILKICREYDVTISLGDGLRPGCLADASDAAQFGELDILGELTRRCQAANVQVMVEGPGHIPLDEIAMNMQREQTVCNDAPFYILGPVVTDCAPGYDHLVGAMGGMVGAFHGAAMLCYVTPKEHIGLPNDEDVKRGIMAFRIAAHAADIALHKPDARLQDDAISDAREAFDWQKQFDLALDPQRARAYRLDALQASNCKDLHDGEYCTMCGPDFCSVRLSKILKTAKLD